MPPGGALHENSGNAANIDENPEDDGNFNEQTTLLNNEEESFALAPVDASALKGMFIGVLSKEALIIELIQFFRGDEGETEKKIDR